MNSMEFSSQVKYKYTDIMPFPLELKLDFFFENYADDLQFIWN